MASEQDLAVGLRAGLYKPTQPDTVLMSVPDILNVSAQAVILREVIVTDISFYQAEVDFEKMKANGTSGVIIRAGQSTWKDTKFSSHWARAGDAGLPRGSYFYYDSRTKPEDQADLWTEIISSDLGEMDHWADYEEVYDGEYGGWNMLYRFMSRMKTNIPEIKLGLYTGYYYWLENSPSNADSLAWFAQFPLWLAWYTDNPSTVRIPQPWSNLLYWQYTHTGDGPAYGVDTQGIDLNNFNGTKIQFSDRYDLPDVTPEPPHEVVIDTALIDQKLNEIDAASSRIRSEISNTFPPTTRLANVVSGVNLNVRSDHYVVNNPSNVVDRLTTDDNPITVHEEWRSPDGQEIWVRISATLPHWAAMNYHGSIFMVYV